MFGGWVDGQHACLWRTWEPHVNDGSQMGWVSSVDEGGPSALCPPAPRLIELIKIKQIVTLAWKIGTAWNILKMISIFQQSGLVWKTNLGEGLLWATKLRKQAHCWRDWTLSHQNLWELQEITCLSSFKPTFPKTVGQQNPFLVILVNFLGVQNSKGKSTWGNPIQVNVNYVASCAFPFKTYSSNYFQSQSQVVVLWKVSFWETD